MKKQIKTTEDGTNKQRTNLIEPIKERQTKWRKEKIPKEIPGQRIDELTPQPKKPRTNESHNEREKERNTERKSDRTKKDRKADRPIQRKKERTKKEREKERKNERKNARKKERKNNRKNDGNKETKHDLPRGETKVTKM